MAEEEVIAEVEAVQAVYGDDCEVIESYPPHLVVHLQPRTADVFSQQITDSALLGDLNSDALLMYPVTLQFVGATIRILAAPKYPEELPNVKVIDSKGLDEQRQKYLINAIHVKASELSSGLMLVALCEEAVEQLSSMNHPDGDCPLCLCSLVDKDAGNNAKPFMKLMSCFHCFHCDCIVKWWNWIQTQNTEEIGGSSSSSVQTVRDQKGNCPVCRKLFLAKDIEHVLDLVGSFTHMGSNENGTDEGILQSDYEKFRRQKYEAILKLQHENNGLIELKKNEVLMPGMFLPQTVAPRSAESNNENIEPQKEVISARSNPHPESSRSGHVSRKHNTNSFKRNFRSQNTKKEAKQWIRKGTDPR